MAFSAFDKENLAKICQNQFSKDAKIEPDLLKNNEDIGSQSRLNFTDPLGPIIQTSVRFHDFVYSQYIYTNKNLF